MQIKQDPKVDVCAAMRCKGVPADFVFTAPFLADMAPTKRLVFESAYPDKKAWLCERCAAKAVVAHGPEVRVNWNPYGPLGMSDGAAREAERREAEAIAEAALQDAMHTRARKHAPQVIPTSAVDAEIKENETYAIETTGMITEFVIETREDFELAAELLAEVKGRLKTLVARKEEITKPQAQALASARALFRPAEAALAQTEAALKQAIGVFTRGEEEAKRKALAEASAAHAAGDSEAVGAALERVVTTKNVAGVTTRKVWRYEITDASEVGRELCSPDDAKIRAWIKAHEEQIANAYGGNPGLPGIRFFEDTIVSSRST